ncbi:hypothetical protein GON03_07295 [Nocardioides sp. MAH-18]|uniref:Uncharacterized protein n=1 Tax=Nocardioides agri TaxID=2682843 RepID=A0A6L6XQF5_9ACTN|nr:MULTISPECIES: hypothetical protein [unclassified Nocardioides]MBA2954121.1 hypothetical protein [Nocardioides sp. CGMCC 1.13656]MVQ48983.1 hypothetical protein [Nocardioides sp. MAH-18]
MTEHPGYLDALARAAGWERPADDLADAARPRPRSRFEPDGPPDLAGDDVAWAETAVEADASGRAAQPTPPNTRQADSEQPSEDVPPVDRPELPATTAEPAAPPVAAAPQRVAAQPATEEVAAREPAPAPTYVEPPKPSGLPTAPVPDTRDRAPAEPATPYPQPEPEPAREPREPHPTATEAVPVDWSDRASPHEPGPAPELAHEARLVARPEQVVATEESAPAEPEADGGPTVVVEIGRIEVRLASEPGAAPRPAAIRPPPGPSLADYLRDRSAGEGRPA